MPITSRRSSGTTIAGPRPFRLAPASSCPRRTVRPSFTFSPDVRETYQEIAAAPDANPPCVLLDPRGVLAWSPWIGNKPGGDGAWRYVDGKWTNLNSNAGWSARFVHLVPLLDGSVLQLIHKDDGKIGLALALLDTGGVDENAINQLIEQLSDDDPDKRIAADAQLNRYGPASWPILEKKMDDQPPEARIRIHQLLRNRIQPTLAGRTLIDGKARIADRLDGGGVLLYAAAGVSIPQQDKPPQVIKPAWISIRPGLPDRAGRSHRRQRGRPRQAAHFRLRQRMDHQRSHARPAAIARQSSRADAPQIRIRLHHRHRLRPPRTMALPKAPRERSRSATPPLIRPPIPPTSPPTSPPPRR